jgi:hypothetical protein
LYSGGQSKKPASAQSSALLVIYTANLTLTIS